MFKIQQVIDRTTKPRKISFELRTPRGVIAKVNTRKQAEAALERIRKPRPNLILRVTENGGEVYYHPFSHNGQYFVYEVFKGQIRNGLFLNQTEHLATKAKEFFP